MEDGAVGLLVSHAQHAELSASFSHEALSQTTMKKTLLIALASLAVSLSASAALILDEPFSYADGSLVSLTTNWLTHSGTVTGQVDVVSEQVVLTQSESEDVNRLLPGGPYSNGVLYASFRVNFSALPAGTGGYFLHLKDDGTSNLKARVFASTSGAASGAYRIGIAKGGNSPVYVPRDLSRETSYLLVVRYVVDTAESTLWIDPISESSLNDRAAATDTTTPVPIHSVALRQSTASGNGMGTLTLDDLKVSTNFCEVANCGSSALNPPALSGIDVQRLPMNGSTGPIPFTAMDGETPADNLVLWTDSSNSALVPTNNIVLGGAGTNRTVTVTPAAGQQGVATVTLNARDADGNVASQSFEVIVGAPTISAVANQITRVGAATAPIAFTVWDAETPLGNLTVTGQSANPALVPNANIVISGSGSNRTTTITPAAGQSGTVAISLTVSDGSSAASNRFLLTVAPRVDPDLDETFAYDDGLVQDVSASVTFPWVVYSPTPPTNDCRVAGQRLFLAGTNSDDVRVFIGYNALDGYYDTNRGYVIYYSLTLQMVSLPTGSGSYFAFFKDAGTFNFKGRLFAATNGAAAGACRVGIANGAASTTAFAPVDLLPGGLYTVTVRYNVDTGESRLWVNATAETSAGVDATDATPPVPIYNVAFRQSAGIGSWFVDNLKVGSSWADVFQAPNWPPTISSIADQTTAYQTATAAIPFTVGDIETAASALLPRVTSTNTVLAPTNNIVLGGSGSNRTIRVTPAPGQSGTSLITVTVADAGGNAASASFVLTVLGLNNPPILSSIENQSTTDGAPTPAIPFTVFDLEQPVGSLVLGAYSDNQNLVPDTSILVSGSGTNRTITVTPLPGQTGSALIGLTASDGVLATTNTFTLTVTLGILLADTFSYADGSITTNSGFFWNTNTGTAGTAWVQGGKLLLDGRRSEDIKAGLTNAPYYPSNNVPLYAGFTVNFSGLPGSAYFTHFTDVANGFKARVFATLSNAAPGLFRLGIVNASGSLAATNPPHPMDLVLGTDYRVVVRYHPGSGTSALWINATNEADLSVAATDAPSSGAITNYSFRQTGGIGALTVDDLLVGTSFEVVKGQVPVSQPPLQIAQTCNVVRIAWPTWATDANFILESKTSLNTAGGWAPAGFPTQTVGDFTVASVTNATGNLFLRLRK